MPPAHTRLSTAHRTARPVCVQAGVEYPEGAQSRSSGLSFLRSSKLSASCQRRGTGVGYSKQLMSCARITLCAAANYRARQVKSRNSHQRLATASTKSNRTCNAKHLVLELAIGHEQHRPLRHEAPHLGRLAKHVCPRSVARMRQHAASRRLSWFEACVSQKPEFTTQSDKPLCLCRSGMNMMSCCNATLARFQYDANGTTSKSVKT